MSTVITCTSLEQVRSHIDLLDRQLLSLIAQRGAYVKQAAAFKRSVAEVPAPQRVEQVIAGVKQLAPEMGADPSVVEATWRAMIAAFIDAETATHAALPTQTSSSTQSS